MASKNTNVKSSATSRSNNDLQSLYNQAYANASASSNPGTLAKSQSDVDSMTVRDRYWDSLNYSYGQQRAASDQSYDNAISQQDRQALARGMQRSSYNAATQANLQSKKVQAQNDIYASQIADYEKQLYQIERDEVSDAQWQAEFDENVRQFNIENNVPMDDDSSGGGGGWGGSGSSSSSSSSGSSKKSTKKTTTTGDGTTSNNLFASDTGATTGTTSIIKPGNNGGKIYQNGNTVNRRTLYTK